MQKLWIGLTKHQYQILIGRGLGSGIENRIKSKIPI